jgi:acyl-CoA thioesterase FadM
MPINISLSHDDRVCLCVAGPGAQGCDITPVRSESREDWIALLGQERAPLLAPLADPYAGTRIWAAVEALRKATGGAEIDLAFEDRNESGAIRFRGGTPEHRLHVLTFPIRLLRGPEQVVALVITPTPASAEPLPDDGFNRAVYALTLSQDGPQHQQVFALRFPLTFRETANLSRSLYFSHYFTWMGRLREAALQPVYAALADQFTTGQWGMVTNRAETRIVGTATAKDVIEGRFWLEKVYGPANSMMDLCYEWQRLLPGGGCESIAFSTMTATWVAILDHGLVEAQPFPAYFQEYVNRMAPPDGTHPAWQIPGAADLGDEIHRSVSSPTTMAVLHEQQFETSLEEANLVGNIYFANYYIWQGRTVDHFFYATAPEYFRDSTQGEFRCVYSKVEHLREAMPFERIAVKMALGALYEHGVQLLLEYFRVMPDGQYVKLAFGEHQAVWMAPSPAGEWRPAPLPAVFKDALLVKAGQGQV